MAKIRDSSLVAFMGVLVYGVSMYAGHVAYASFWTSRSTISGVPWYFIGRVFIAAIFAAAGLLLTLGVGLLTQASLGKDAWASLAPALLFLSPPVGQGVNVLLHTDRIWDRSTASTEWETFDQYLSSNSLAAFVTLAIATTLILTLRWQRRRAESSQ